MVSEPLVMQFHVAQLLKEGVGAVREYMVDDEMVILDESRPSRVTGTVTLLRVSNGILARAHLSTEVELECARCLEPFTCRLVFDFEEEYIPVLNIYLDEYNHVPEDKDIFTIDENHFMDITDAARQFAILAKPMKPLCRHDCPGITI